ncbi:MAG: hypothetical protein IJ831_05325 [Spirochaetales bacterium]|nr:hypothetical protein [Spirochaetales bacterium]
MKKLIALIAIITIVASVAFAATDNAIADAATETSNVDVTLSITGKVNATWNKDPITTQPTAWATLSSDATDIALSEDVLEGTSYITVQTNKKTQSVVTLSATPLVSVAGDKLTYTVSMTATENGGSVSENHSATVTNANVASVGTFTTTGDQLRLQQAKVDVAVTQAVIKAAAEGDYTATLTMTITTL